MPQRTLTAPEEVWPLLDFVKPEVLPNGMKGCFVVRLYVRQTNRYLVYSVPYARVDDANAWRQAIEVLVERRAEELRRYVVKT